MEIWTVILFTGAAAAIRLVGLGAYGLSHFDEGVYALWGLGAGYPGKEFFAPPLFPLLLRASLWLLGRSDVAAQLVSVLFGTATVPLVWRVASCWYGTTAASAAATLAALSGLHIEFSRMPLTDAAFTFWFALALWAASQLYARCRRAATDGESISGKPAAAWPWAIWLGLAAAAAMNTKYTGFLVIIMAGIPMLAAVSASRARRELRWMPAAYCLALAVAIALVGYWPWFQHVQSELGYAKLLRHQQGYTTGLYDWPANLRTLLAGQWYLSRGVGWLAPAVAVVVALVAQRSWPMRWIHWAIVGAGAAAGLVMGDAAGWLLGWIALVVRLRAAGPALWTRPEVLHGTWLIGLFALTPLYRPYARLMLPLAAAGWIAGGELIAQLLRSASERMHTRGVALALAAAGTLLVAIAWCSRLLPTSVSGEADAPPKLAQTCERIVAHVPRDEPVLSFARPPVLFYGSGRRSLAPVQDLGWLADQHASEPRYLLLDAALIRDNPNAREQLARAGDRLQELAREPYRPSAAVLLDDFGRDVFSAGFATQARDTYQLILYRVVRN